jgi:hypothetical protein
MASETRYFINPNMEEDEMDAILLIILICSTGLFGLALHKTILVAKRLLIQMSNYLEILFS